jgi:hypothetical protein
MFADGNPVAADDPLPCGKFLDVALRELVARVDPTTLDDGGRAVVAASGEIVRIWDGGRALVSGEEPLGTGTVSGAFVARAAAPAA